MFAIISSIISGVLSPLFGWLQNKDNVTLGEFTAFSETERAVYVAYLQAQSQANTAKIANNWWGAHLMVYLFGLPAAIHWNAVFLATVWPDTFGVVSALPGPYADVEFKIALSFFILAPAMPIISSVSQMLNRK